eukprot:g12831.t1
MVYESTKLFLNNNTNEKQNRKEAWRVREQALWFSLQFVQLCTHKYDIVNAQDTNVKEDSLHMKDDIEAILVMRKAMEPNPAVQQLLVHPEITNAVNEALNAKWEGQQDRIKREMDEQKKELDELIVAYESAEKKEPGGEKALVF